MKGLRKTIGICLILALTSCALIAVPIYADNGNQGQTKYGQQAPAPAPESDSWLEALVMMMAARFIWFF